ncbi:MAG: glycosyltransferase [Anaerolineales bacterium]
MSIQVSVVVPTYQRPHLLLKCLHALVQQNFPPDAYEIIVVDDADSDETRSLVEGFSAKEIPSITASASSPGAEAGACPPIRYYPATLTQGPAAARNLGWRTARGEIIAFTDDDCLPDPDWLRKGLSAMQADVAGVSGKVIVPIPNIPTDYEKNVSRLGDCEFLTANCFFRRDVLEAVNGFDERYTMAWREDSDIQFKLLSLSCKLVCAPNAKVIHPVREASWGVSIQEQRKSMFDALLYKKYPDLYRERISASPPLRYYAILLATLGFALAVVFGGAAIAFAMFALWAGLILHFTYLRLQYTKHSPEHVLEMLVTSLLIPYLSVFWRLYGALYFRVLFW